MPQTGTLTFQIYTSDAFIPIEGATAVVRQQDPPGKLLGIRVTDSSGKTDPIEIVTPDRSLGLSPERVIQPWTGLNVLVEHPDFERVFITGVQVFPGINTLQAVQLLPLRENDAQIDRQQDYSFTPQPIWEDTP